MDAFPIAELATLPVDVDGLSAEACSLLPFPVDFSSFLGYGIAPVSCSFLNRKNRFLSVFLGQIFLNLIVYYF